MWPVFFGVANMGLHRVRFLPSDRVIDVRTGDTVLDAAQNLGLGLDHVCGGCCSCATCRVVIVSGQEHLNQPKEEELDQLSTDRKSCERSRLACQTEVHADLTVQIPGHLA